MIDKLRKIFCNHREILSYVFFGVLTTAVNFLVYFPLYNYVFLSATVSNLIAWIAAVIFAFFVNKRFVFRSQDWSKKVLVKQIFEFMAYRIVSGALETGLLLITADILLLDGNLWKIMISILVVIINYLGSKLLVFKNQ